MRAVILSIGDELTLGQTVDTNSAYLSARLIERGAITLYHKTVPDDCDAIARSIQEAANSADLILVTGGLGPTQDDLTRQALARVMGVELELHEPSLGRIERFFKERGRVMTESNRVQAMCPRGADMLTNFCGTAPGLKARCGRACVVVMPGVPSEMKSMFEHDVQPMLDKGEGRVIMTRTLHTFGWGESQVGEKLGELMCRDRSPTVGTTVSGGVVSIRIRSEETDRDRADQALEDTVKEVMSRLGQIVFGREEDTLQSVVGSLLKQSRRTVVTAESCTGGLVSAMLTAIPGASVYMLGGWTVYDNRMKQKSLGISDELLQAHGAVSEAVVRSMAEQALNRSGADVALALSGIAGPDGGTSEKPVGTVWIALGVRGQRIHAERFFLPGDREMVRMRAARTALNLLRLELLNAKAVV